jgi:hypothetical protein
MPTILSDIAAARQTTRTRSLRPQAEDCEPRDHLDQLSPAFSQLWLTTSGSSSAATASICLRDCFSAGFMSTASRFIDLPSSVPHLISHDIVETRPKALRFAVAERDRQDMFLRSIRAALAMESGERATAFSPQPPFLPLR